jgi:hypothetical protein
MVSAKPMGHLGACDRARHDAKAKIDAAIPIIIPPPTRQKYSPNNIEPPVSCSSILLAFGSNPNRHRGREEKWEYLAEDQFFNQQGDSQRKHHSSDHR